MKELAQELITAGEALAETAEVTESGTVMFQKAQLEDMFETTGIGALVKDWQTALAKTIAVANVATAAAGNKAHAAGNKNLAYPSDIRIGKDSLSTTYHVQKKIFNPSTKEEGIVHHRMSNRYSAQAPGNVGVNKISREYINGKFSDINAE